MEKELNLGWTHWEVQQMPSAGYLFFAAFLFATLAVVHLRWPGQIKSWTDSLGRVLGTSQYLGNFDVGYYRMVGGIYGFCAAMMLIGAILSSFF